MPFLPNLLRNLSGAVRPPFEDPLGSHTNGLVSQLGLPQLRLGSFGVSD